jgi:predicted transcriptional regulator YheO
MSHKLKDDLLKAFSGKIENKQAFIMQFVMTTVQKGNPPPKREELEKIIDELIQDGTFEEKGNLLILKKKSPQGISVEEEEEELPVNSTLKNRENYSKVQFLVLEAFQGSFENKSALLMNVTMNEVSKGKAPPSKDELNTVINDLIQEGVLESKDTILIKKK